MKELVSLAVAVPALAVGVSVAHTSDPAPEAPAAAEARLDARASRAKVVRLVERARTHSRRVGLTPGARPRVAADPRLRARQGRRLRRVVDFLAERREVPRPVDERPVPRARPRGATLASRTVHHHRRASRLALRLGLDRPARLRLARSRDGQRRQLAHWRSVSRWLAARSERVRPGERPLRERIRHHDELMCIARHESKLRWNISTGNGYYGGLQMDRAFQRAYAPRLYARLGTADNWSREQQMRAAERAIGTRGFTPWPNTARMCGLR